MGGASAVYLPAVPWVLARVRGPHRGMHVITIRGGQRGLWPVLLVAVIVFVVVVIIVIVAVGVRKGGHAHRNILLVGGRRWLLGLGVVSVQNIKR
jgi:hypothetical protein